MSLKFLSVIMIQSFHATPAFRCNKILSPGAAEVQLEHRDTIFAGNPSPWAKIFSWLIWLNLNLQEGTQILMWWNIYFYPDGCVSSVLLQIVLCKYAKKKLPLISNYLSAQSTTSCMVADSMTLIRIRGRWKMKNIITLKDDNGKLYLNPDTFFIS